MNGVEAAASLFGTDEPSSDPFAALGADPAPQSSSSVLFGDDGASGASDFFNPEVGAEENAKPEPPRSYVQEPQNSNYSTVPFMSGLGATTGTQQAWYGDQVQPSHIEEHAVEADLTTGHDMQYSQFQGRGTTTYDPYAPSPHQTTSSTSPAYPQTQYNVSAYSQPTIPPNPYTPAPAVPAQPSTHTAYSYAPSTLLQHTASTYVSPYAPTTHSTYPSSSITSPPALSQAPPPTLPPAPLPVATISRPKVSNAYDPPFPATKSTRRGGRVGLGQQPFTAYNTYQTPSPPISEHHIKSLQYPTRVPQQHPTQGSVYHQQPYMSDDGIVQPNNVVNAPLMNVVRPDPSAPEETETVWPYKTLDSAPADESYGYDQATRESAFASLTQDLPQSEFPAENVDTDQEIKPLSALHGPPSLPGDSNIVEQSQSSFGSRVHTSSPVSHSGYIRSESPHRYTLPASHASVQQMPFGRSSPLTESDISLAALKAPPLLHTESLGNAKSEFPRAVQPSGTGPRAGSPASITMLTNDNGVQSPQLAYLSKSLGGDSRASSPPNAMNGQQTKSSDPYAPKSHINGFNGERTSSPGSFSARSSSGPPVAKQSTMNSRPPPRSDVLRDRSMSGSSVLSTTSTSPEDPYAPSQNTRRQKNEADYGSYTSRYNYPQVQEVNHNNQLTQLPQPSQVQEVYAKPFHTPYAPSPSLLGANDPLGRTVARVPVFSFGFGGKFVTCFHGAASLMTGFDVALSSRNSTGVHIRVLKTLIPESALNATTASFPGPLYSDSGALTGLVRTGASTQTKTKKANVITYLSERAEEIAMGLPYLKPDSTEGHQAEGKLALVKVLKVMVESDGRLTGTPQIDNAVRAALVPRLERSSDSKGSLTTAEGFTPDLPSVPYPIVGGVSVHLNESPISVTTLRPSALNTIQDFLLRGERRQACHFALDEKLWAHAMVIASSIDKDAWKEVVNEFLKTELGANATNLSSIQNGDGQPSTNGRESLRVAYSLFSGQGAAAVQELIPQNILSKTAAHLQPVVVPHITPRTPNFSLSTTTAASIPTESLSHWAETAAMMVSSPLSPETSAALTALGDQLVANHMYEAAHVCYLLAPQTSPLGGIGNPAARIVLVGSRSPQSLPSFSKDTDSLIFSEIVEFALSLTPTSRGQDTFQGIPHLQAYRFIRAIGLAEIGDIALASRYCEAITTTINRSSPYFTPILVDQLKGLSDRIVGVAHVDKMGSWMGAKLSKPSLDTIGGWLENRFTKIVTGDTDTATPPEEEYIKAEDRSFAGPFAHYSTISSATPSARSSPQPTFVNLNTLPPHRSGSAMASSSPYNHPQIDRASSAMDYVKRKPSPGPRISSAGAATTTFTSAPSFGQALSNNRSPNGYSPQDDLMTARPSLHTEDDNPVQEATWWGSSTYEGNSTTQTPTASTFLRVDEGALTPSSDGFVSLMDNDVYSVASKSPANGASEQPVDDEEDLGFGNSRRDKATSESELSKPTPTVDAPKETAPPPTASAPTPSGSWISRWWKKSDSATPGPIKASLGEESAFYYDKEQKRWVNKKAGGNDPPKPSIPPPPPSRAQTASPGMTSQRPLGASDAGPPPRSASAIDLSTSPPSRTVMRVRSNLVPMPESAPSTPTGTRLAPSGPPPGRPKSQASKRNIRNRYVDVFQQEGGA